MNKFLFCPGLEAIGNIVLMNNNLLVLEINDLQLFMSIGLTAPPLGNLASPLYTTKIFGPGCEAKRIILASPSCTEYHWGSFPNCIY